MKKIKIMFTVAMLAIIGTTMTASAQSPNEQGTYTPPENQHIHRQRVATTLDVTRFYNAMTTVFSENWLEMEQVGDNQFRGFYSDNILDANSRYIFNIALGGGYAYITVYHVYEAANGRRYGSIDEDVENPIVEKIVAALK
ncbi:MAG TPA: hypothetical protein VNA88_14670 [Candidatus Kapabacteria bacterium]|jgi:hypothetical protein|nr:hypothetical protein [Candidatus Kapabacteria bacterium]